MNLQGAWIASLNVLQQISPMAYPYFSQALLIGLEGDTLTLKFGSEQNAHTSERYIDDLLSALAYHIQGVAQIQLTYEEPEPQEPREIPTTTEPGMAWQITLSQLQHSMPRASFDTWVRDTEVINYANGLFKVGVRNAYARDWLESRITSTVEKLLTGIMGRSVSVSFVVDDGDYLADNEVTEDEDTGDDDGLTVEPADLTHYQSVVKPNQIVLMSGYVGRALEQGDMSCQQASCWVGFLQAIYPQWKKGQGLVRNIPHTEAIAFSMMSRASFFRELSRRSTVQGREVIAGGMVEIIPEPAVSHSAHTDRRFDNANRYRVYRTPRLTRRDCAVIEAKLYRAASTAATHQEADERVLAALEELSAADPADYLESEPQVTAGNVWPWNVQEIVRRVLGLEGDMPEDLHNASERVYDRIIRAYGSILITHYFLRTVVPTLGLTHPQAWLITLLRDRCWYDHDTHTRSDFVIVPGGLDAIARWVGVSRRSVERWLADPVFSAFVRLADKKSLDAGWLDDNTEVFLVNHQEPILDEISDKVRLYLRQNETLFTTKRDSICDKMRLYLRQSETRLNINLNKPLTNRNNPELTTSVNNFSTKPGAGGDGWDFDLLLRLNPVKPENKNFLKTHSNPLAFVSWLLYAYSLEANAKSRVKSPVGLAVTQLGSDPHAGAGPIYDQLASLPRSTLRVLFERAIRGAMITDPRFRQAFGDAPAEQLKELATRLGFSY